MMLGSLSKENELGQMLTACALKKDREGGRRKKKSKSNHLFQKLSWGNNADSTMKKFNKVPNLFFINFDKNCLFSQLYVSSYSN